MPPRGGKHYDEDDYYDYEDDDGDWDDHDAPVQTKAKAAPKGKAAPAPAKAAGASKLAQALCDPPPLRPNGKMQQGAKKEPAAIGKQQPSFPITPPQTVAAAAAAGGTYAAPPMQPFAFDSPSPDDVVLAAQQGKPLVGVQKPITGPTKGTSTISLPQSKFLSTPSPGQQRHLQAASPAAELASGVAALSVADAAHATSSSTPAHGAAALGKGSYSAAPVAERRRVADYVLEADLARACQALDYSSAAGSSGASYGGEDAAGARPGLHLVVLGHVDAGKSTLMGRLLHDLGVMGKKEAHKNAKESAEAGKSSFSWAWALDERPEERARGVTVDIAMQRFQTARFNVTLMDAPGHRDFVPNMISGAAQADAALLLVDGSPGGFEAGFEGGGGGGYGQTREHAQLARSLGVEQLAVVVSKLDTCDFSQERFEYIKASMLPFLTRSCGFRESSLQWLPAVGPSGQNLVHEATEPMLKSWWSGPTVVRAIDHFSPRHRLVDKPLRMPIADVFKTKTGAMAVGGKIEGGALKVGSRVVVIPCPLHDLSTVKTVDVNGQSCQVGRAGDSADVVLAGLDVSSVATGAVLCHPDFPVPLVSRFEARVLVLDIAIPLLRGHQVTLHAHTAREAGHISGLVSLVDAKTGETTKLKPRCILKGQTAVLEVSPARPMCLEEYADYKALGRIALREGGKTIAVGIITRIID